MFRDLLSSRLIQGGLVFFVLVVGGSLLYSWHALRATEADLGPIPQTVVSPLENTPATNTAPIDFQTEGVTNTPEENTDTPIPEATEALPNETEFTDIADAFLPDDLVSEEEALAEDVPVSPFGFGPYPEVPADLPENLMPSWTWSDERRQNMYGRAEDYELMGRVIIKLWNQGDKEIVGVLRRDNDGKVYPTYPDTMYVTSWEEMDTRHGTVRVPSSTFGYASKMVPLYPYVHKYGHLPDDINFIDYENQGYDPYNFLNLK